MQVQVQIVPVRVQYALNNVQYDSAGAYCTRRGAYCTRTGAICTRTGALNKHLQSPPFRTNPASGSPNHCFFPRSNFYCRSF